MRRRAAFTMIEMLTVLAVTAIIMGIIIYPLVQSFNMTRAAQSFADAQERARQVVDGISREITNSAGVRDNNGLRGAIAVSVPGKNGTFETVLLDHAKLDILRPAEGDPTKQQGGAYYNPDTGRYDPTLRAPKGQIVLPVAPGMTLVRYFIGLRQPLAPNALDPAQYNEPFSGIIMKQNGKPDNLYVLYRAEVQPVVVSGGVVTTNTAFFKDVNGKPDLDDPYFFSQDLPVPGSPAERQAKADRIKNWLRKSTIVTELNRYDMIQPLYDKRSREPIYDGNVPRVVGLIQFRPTPVSDEPAAGQAAVRLGEETDYPQGIAPDVYRTNMGSWSSAVIKVFPWLLGDPPTATSSYYFASVSASSSDASKIYYHRPASPTSADLDVFGIDTYQNALLDRTDYAYPFSAAMFLSNKASNWQSDADFDLIRQSLKPFYADVHDGKVYTSFGVDEVGLVDANGKATPPATPNIPAKAIGPEQTPTVDNDTTGNFYDAQYQSINRLFNRVWNDTTYEFLRPNVHRFIDLRVTPQPDGSPSPLNVDPNQGIVWPQVSIVPGSEIVTGPDQNPGPNYGNPIQYMRTTHAPGPNQYRINYTNQAEPSDSSGAVSYAALGFATNPPANYNPHDFLSAVIQPRYKVGYVQFNSDPNAPLPNASGNDTITIFYRFQFNNAKEPAIAQVPAKPAHSADIFAVDYDTRQLMQVLLTIKNFPQSSLPNPQTVTLKAAAPVRNLLR